MSAEKILEAITVTAELTATQLSETAKAAMAEELLGYGPGLVLAALNRCRREVKGRLTLAEIIDRIDDGRPEPDEAWGMCPKDEFSSVVLTNEMQLAMRNAWPLLRDGDKVAARMAFKAAYERIVADNRARGVKPTWEADLGEDRTGREAALLEAVLKNRLSSDVAKRLLPPESYEKIEAISTGRQIAHG